MILFAIVNKDTGELENNCSICQIGNVTEPEMLELHTLSLPDDHMLVELMHEEISVLRSSVAGVQRPVIPIEVEMIGGKEILGYNDAEIIEYTVKLDPTKMVATLNERPKVEDHSKPIEVEGTGGKEIIGYETKPVGIVVER